MKMVTMNFRSTLLSMLTGILSLCSFSLSAQDIQWFNPQKTDQPCIQQRGWAKEMKNAYARVPERMEGVIRKEVYSLSRNSAGLSIHFFTNSPTIHIRYKVVGGISMPHMPATGVSGIDLYNIDKQGQWEYRYTSTYQFGKWVEGKVADGVKQPSGTQCEYVFRGLDQSNESEYRLYFPLYNVVSEMEIGVEQGSIFKVAPVRKEKPIVVYGTSVTQGACASRPGNAWTNMVSRRMDWPVINLGFSGFGRLDPEFIDLISEIDAAIFVLDCNGNLNLNSCEKNVELVKDAVRKLRAAHPDTPILISDFPGYAFQRHGHGVNSATRAAYDEIHLEGDRLYYLSCEEQAEPLDGKVDGIHPNDLGMNAIANAFEAKFREILHQPVGAISTQIPVTQRRDILFYGWMERHNSILEGIQAAAPRNVILGDSITQYWGGFESRSNGPETWRKYMESAAYRNMGYGWDYVENLLWRVYHGELDGFQAENILVNIGTNNLGKDNDEDIVKGIHFLLDEIRCRQPQASIKFVGIFPRRGREERVTALNRAIQEEIEPAGYGFLDCGDCLVQKNGKIVEGYFIDGLHPNEKGYRRIAHKIFK